MPVWTYECTAGHGFDRRDSIARREETPIIPCPECGADAKLVINWLPRVNNTDVVILDYPGSKALKAGYVHSHGPKNATKVSVGAAGALNPSPRPLHPLATAVSPDWKLPDGTPLPKS
mgnify:CR=1 FL=1